MHFQAVFLIMIEEQESGNGLVRKGFSELLHDPTAGGMASNVEVNNLPPVVPDNKEAIQQLERDRWHGEGIVIANGRVEEVVQAVDFRAGPSFGEAQGFSICV